MSPQSSVLDAVVFDFDGVILESADVKTEAFSELFRGDARAVAFHQANQGTSRFDKFRFYHENVLGEAYDDLIGAAMSSAFDELTMERILQSPMVAGAEGLLGELADAAVPAYVASGTPDDVLAQIVYVLGLRRWFAGVFGTPRSKAEIITAILAERGFARDRVLVVGDARADLDGALGADVLFVARVAVGIDPRATFTGFAGPFVRDLADLHGRWDEVLTHARMERRSRA